MQFIIKSIKGKHTEIELFNGEPTTIGTKALPNGVQKGDVIFIDIDISCNEVRSYDMH